MAFEPSLTYLIQPAMSVDGSHKKNIFFDSHLSSQWSGLQNILSFFFHMFRTLRFLVLGQSTSKTLKVVQPRGSTVAARRPHEPRHVFFVGIHSLVQSHHTYTTLHNIQSMWYKNMNIYYTRTKKHNFFRPG